MCMRHSAHLQLARIRCAHAPHSGKCILDVICAPERLSKEARAGSGRLQGVLWVGDVYFTSTVRCRTSRVCLCD